MNRGQSLLETTVAVGVLLVALGAVTAAVRASSNGAQPAAARLVASSELSNAATELVAATAYDPAALNYLRAAAWSVRPPTPPSPAPPGTAGPVQLTSTVNPSGDGRVVRVTAQSGPAQADVTLSLRFAAPPPGAILQGTLGK